LECSNLELTCQAVDNYALLIALGFVPPFKVELGPGKFMHTMPGVVGIDLSKEAAPGCQIYWNLENGIPLPDNCAEYIHSNQLCEHIARDRFIHFMNEQFRVLQPGGLAFHVMPHFLSPYAMGDPTHKNTFSEVSFWYFSINPETGNPFVSDFSDYGIKCSFILEKQEVRPAVDVSVWLRKPLK